MANYDPQVGSSNQVRKLVVHQDYLGPAVVENVVNFGFGQTNAI